MKRFLKEKREKGTSSLNKKGERDEFLKEKGRKGQVPKREREKGLSS